MELPENNVRFLWRKFFDTHSYKYYQKLSKSSDKNEQRDGLKFIAGYATGVSAVVDSYSTEETKLQLATIRAIKEEIERIEKNLEHSIKDKK